MCYKESDHPKWQGVRHMFEDNTDFAPEKVDAEGAPETPKPELDPGLFEDAQPMDLGIDEESKQADAAHMDLINAEEGIGRMPDLMHDDSDQETKWMWQTFLVTLTMHRWPILQWKPSLLWSMLS